MSSNSKSTSHGLASTAHHESCSQSSDLKVIMKDTKTGEIVGSASKTLSDETELSVTTATRPVREKNIQHASVSVNSSNVPIHSSDNMDDKIHQPNKKRSRTSESDNEDEEAIGQSKRTAKVKRIRTRPKNTKVKPARSPKPKKTSYIRTTKSVVLHGLEEIKTVERSIRPAVGSTSRIEYKKIPGHVRKKPLQLGRQPHLVSFTGLSDNSSQDPEHSTNTTALALLNGTVQKNKYYNPTETGFENLSGEIRNRIYALTFDGRGVQVKFGDREGFGNRSAQFLRVNKLVYKEGRKFLYGMTRFVLDRSRIEGGTYFQKAWREIGYTNIVQFFKEIGPINTSLIRNIGIALRDNYPKVTPNWTAEQRYFLNDRHLVWILIHLANYGMLDTLTLAFSGRLQFKLGKQFRRFADLVSLIDVDKLVFTHFGWLVTGVRPGHVYQHTGPDKDSGNITTAAQNALRAAMTRDVNLKQLAITDQSLLVPHLLRTT